ncbi:hypothetical protein EWH99_08070 [Sporolactobacillus sp. THM7-7]|nr:hypothetical protein EWH99_08070 [Sporolactobacillus sp. THM7-7]
MSHYRHLNPLERESILKHVILVKSIRAIAALLGRSPATISCELKRHQQRDGTHSSVHVEARYRTRQRLADH